MMTHYKAKGKFRNRHVARQAEGQEQRFHRTVLGPRLTDQAQRAANVWHRHSDDGRGCPRAHQISRVDRSDSNMSHKGYPASATYTDEQLQRMRDVHAEQVALGMAPRSDSRLTLQYATRSCDPEYATARCVAEELVLVDFFHQSTLYPEIIEAVMRKVAHALKQEFPVVPWGSVWSSVRFYVPTILKLFCIDTAGRATLWTSG